MPPRVRVSREEILAAAIKLVREQGEGGINARAIAAEMGCSTQPIFSNFASMEETRAAVLSECHRVYGAYIKKEMANGKWPRYKAYGMAYIRFAIEEKELFRLLFMRDRTHEAKTSEDELNEVYTVLQEQLGVSSEDARLIHLEMWVFVHGIATLLVTSYQSMSEELISLMITDVYNGLRTKYVKEKQDGSC